MRAELSAEAQRWYLTALASDPRNVEALTGLAVTCQHLVSNPWWAEPRVVATASDLGREAAAIALSIAPGHSAAHCVQGMLYSAAGQLDDAGHAFERALTTDSGQGTTHGFAGYNAAFLGRADETVPAIERAMRLDRSDRRHSIWLFFGGFAELLLNRTEKVDSPFSQVLGTQSQLRERAGIPCGCIVHNRTPQGGDRHRSAIPCALSAAPGQSV